MDYNRIEHLKMIQAIIDRQAKNSSTQKNWLLLVFGSLLALLKCNIRLAPLLYPFPLIGLWILDSYYLRQERLFRRLYDSVRISEEKVDFSMDANKFSHTENCIKTFLSPSVSLFYLVFIILTLCVTLTF